MRRLAFLLSSMLVAAMLLTACSSYTSSKPPIAVGEYSGVSVAGQPVVIDVVGDKVRVNAIDAVLDDPTTTAGFTVDVGGTVEDFQCANGNEGHTLRCAVRRSKQLRVQVPCSRLTGPSTSPGASPSPTPASTPVASASGSPPTAQPPSAGVPLCSSIVPNTETIDLLHLCSSAPCSDQPA